jgi:predicted metal-dependent enzyme (double-stranded beta helix superfamily)
MPLIHERTNAVREAIARIKAAGLGDDNHDHAQIEAARAALLALAARSELFPVAQFPYLYAQRSGFYRLAEDADHRNALYVQVSTNEHGGNSPHQHPYWAIIAGVRGNEYNVLYQRTDDGQVEGRGRLGQVGEVSVEPGVALYIPHDTYHTIGTRGGEVGIHLHFYGIGTDTPEHRGAARFSSPDSDVVVARARPIEPGEIGVQRVWLRDVQSAAASSGPVTVLQAGAIDSPLPEPLRGAHRIDPEGGTPAGLPEDHAVPIVLAGHGRAVRIAATQLARLGYAHTFWFDPEQPESREDVASAARQDTGTRAPATETAHAAS